MVEHPRADEAALAPGRDDRHRHARAEAVGQAVGGVLAAAPRIHHVVDLAFHAHASTCSSAACRRQFPRRAINLYNLKRPQSSVVNQSPDGAYFAALFAIQSAA